MSNRSRKFLIGLGGAIVLSFVIAAVAIVAYSAGRSSAKETTAASPTVVVSVEGDSVTVESGLNTGQGTAESAETPAPEEGQAEGQGTVVSPAEGEGTPEADEPAGPTAAPTIDAATEAQSREEAPRVPVELAEEDTDLLLEVWEIIDREFDGPLPEEDEVTYSAIRGSLELLDDDYTRFINPEMAERMREQLNGSFEGIGAFVDMNPDGYLVIVRPMEGQPADRAGLLANDLVTHVNGRSVLGKTLEEITAEIKGPEGSEVTLTIWRPTLDEPFDVTVEREKIVIPIVSGEMLDNNIAYVRLTGFSANAAQQLEAKLEDLLGQDPIGLILDLRDNPGGFLSQSVQVADLFLGDGVVTYERDGRDMEEVFESEDGDLAEQIELVVLVNAGSASASEIVSGAIRDRDRGVLIGETTFGKGSVQQSHTLSDGSELRVTIARWYTPDNQSIDKNGIAPDIPVDSPEEFGTENDTQLQRAIEYLLEGQ
ncbi:MAG: S41 family peptidase [Candidatus Promineifilaceae bacterium]